MVADQLTEFLQQDPGIRPVIHFIGMSPDVEDLRGVGFGFQKPLPQFHQTVIFHDVAYSRGFEFLEQTGSGYIFSDGKNRLVISSETYLGKFIVWKVPTKTFAE